MPIATEITLNIQDHVYTDSQGREYTSVSRIIERYKEPFDRMAIAQKQSERTGQTVEDILAEWSQAAPYGTAVHQQIENFFRGNEAETHLIENYLPEFETWKNSNHIFHPERILCLEELRIAGTADMLVEHADGTWSILDWKTNKAIWKNGYGGKKLKAPLDHLDDCNFIWYSLQLNLYGRMLGKPINKLSLVHLPRGTGSMEIMTCPNLQDEVDLMLEDWKLQGI